MFKYLILIPTIFPLIGVFLMEKGAYGISIGQFGFENGASLAYFCYVFVLLLFFWIFKKKSHYISAPLVFADEKVFYRYSYIVISVHLLMILSMLGLFGAYEVWTGQIGKGEFRAGLGHFGSIAYLMTKYISPCALAYQAFLYINSRRCFKQRLLWGTGLLFGVLLGSTWGFKSTGISIILPSLLIVYWNSGFFLFLKISSFVLSLMLLMGAVFDDTKSMLSTFEAMWVRLTVIQGDVSWYIWGLFSDSYEFPSYIKTLFAVIGDRFLALLTGIGRDDYGEWVTYHFDLIINLVVGLPLDVVKGGHTIVGTPFSEGLVMLGLYGVFFMAIWGGWISAFVHNRIQKALLVGRGMAAALWASYFCLIVFSWLRGGAIVQMFHISVFVGFLLSYFFILAARSTVVLRKM